MQYYVLGRSCNPLGAVLSSPVPRGLNLRGPHGALHKLEIVMCRCLQSMEPVLLVGETGTGKTTVCQMAALMRGQRLHILNCNQHTETSDFLGGFRPARHVSCTLCAALQASCWCDVSARLRLCNIPCLLCSKMHALQALQLA